jgi:hypothetical protein
MLMHRYVKTSAATTQVELSRMGRRTVVAGAWGYLCHSARESATTPTVGD